MNFTEIENKIIYIFAYSTELTEREFFFGNFKKFLREYNLQKSKIRNFSEKYKKLFLKEFEDLNLKDFENIDFSEDDLEIIYSFSLELSKNLENEKNFDIEYFKSYWFSYLDLNDFQEKILKIYKEKT